MELELAGNKKDLEFHREYPLSKEPLRMDLLIVKKLADVRIENEVGRIFKAYNIIEYKSPEDSLTIDDFVKTAGYVCQYKALGEWVDQIPLKELTMSLFREAVPREMMASLREEGFRIEERFPGIYYVSGKWPFATQIVATGRLEPAAHRSFRILSKKASEEDVRGFLEKARRMTEPGDRNNADAVLQVSTSANREMFEKIRRDSIVCQALRELMKDEIAEERREGKREGIREGKREGIREGRQEALLSVIRNLMESMKLTAKEAMNAMGVSEDEQRKIMPLL